MNVWRAYKAATRKLCRRCRRHYLKVTVFHVNGRRTGLRWYECKRCGQM